MKSVVSFVRKELGWKGKSEHTGRGCYWMDADENPSYDEKLEQLERHLLPKWRSKGYVENVEQHTNEDGLRSINILLDRTHFDTCYRLVYINEGAHMLAGVAMVMQQIDLNREKAKIEAWLAAS